MIVIPMAGESSRFLRAGYDRPKYMLDLHGRPVFDYALASFRRFFGKEPIVVVIREAGGVQDFVKDRLAALGVSCTRVISLKEKTAGQAATVSLGLRGAGLSLVEPLTIFNIDTFRPGYDIAPIDAAADGFLETFSDGGLEWSFVLPEEKAGRAGGEVRWVAEKERISGECSNGLYRFSSANLFLDAYAREQRNPTQSLAEHYIAPVLNQLIIEGRTVRYRHLERKATIFCGTPNEYEALKALTRLPDALRASTDA